MGTTLAAPLLGVRDDDSLPQDAVISYLRPIFSSSQIPVLVDGNWGFANLDSFKYKLVLHRQAAHREHRSFEL
jgi:2-methylisocitrate lyase-like PEP mutase family enzyme